MKPKTSASCAAVALIAAQSVATHAHAQSASAPTRNAERRRARQEIHFTTGSPPPSFDPHLSGSALTRFWASYLFEGLTRFGPTGEWQLGAAEKITWSQDKKTVTFLLRRGLVWHDRQPLTAEHFAYAFRRLASPSVASELGYLTVSAALANARDVLAGKKPPEVLGVRADNATTLVLTLSRPLPFLPDLLATTAFSPTRADLVAPARDGSPGGPFQVARRIIGNGPFALTAFENHARIRLESFPGYWDAASIGPSALEMPVATEAPLSSVRLLETGTLDLVWGVPPESQAALGQLKLKTIPYRSGALWQLIPNARKGRAFEDARVRRLLAASLDRREHVHRILGFLHARPTAFLVPSYLRTGAFKDAVEPRFEGAKTGVPLPKSIVLLASDSSIGRREGEYFQQKISKALGVPVKLDLAQTSIRLERIDRGDFDLAIAASIPTYPDALSFLEEFRSDSSANTTGYASREFDAALDAADASATVEARVSALAAAEKILLHDVATLPTYESGNVIAFPSTLEGVRHSVYGASPDLRFARWRIQSQGGAPTDEREKKKQKEVR